MGKPPPRGDEAHPRRRPQAAALKIINAARSTPRDFALLLFLAETGCRAGGIVPNRDNPRGGLRLGNCRATVREKGRGGNRKARTVYYSEGTAQAIQAYLNQRPQVNDQRVFLTLSAKSTALAYAGLYQMLKRYARRLGILDNGGDLKLVSQLMGHSTVQVTDDIYGARADKVLAEHHRRYSWVSSVGETK